MFRGAKVKSSDPKIKTKRRTLVIQQPISCFSFIPSLLYLYILLCFAFYHITLRIFIIFSSVLLYLYDEHLNSQLNIKLWLAQLYPKHLPVHGNIFHVVRGYVFSMYINDPISGKAYSHSLSSLPNQHTTLIH